MRVKNLLNASKIKSYADNAKWVWRECPEGLGLDVWKVGKVCYFTFRFGGFVDDSRLGIGIRGGLDRLGEWWIWIERL